MTVHPDPLAGATIDPLIGGLRTDAPDAVISTRMLGSSG